MDSFMKYPIALILVLVISLPGCTPFAPQHTQNTNNIRSSTFPSSTTNRGKQHQQTKRSRLNVADPSNVSDMMTTLFGSDETQIALLSTMYSATSGAVKHSNAWSFLWFHGGTVDQYSNGQSLAPIPLDTNSIGSVKDYFLPTPTEEVTKRALQSAADIISNSKNGDIVTSGADYIKIDQAMPGASLPSSKGLDNINPNISRKEIELVSRNIDLISNRVPIAVSVFAMVDFFFFGSKDVYDDELEEDRVSVAGEWALQSGVRVLGIVAVTFLTIICGNIFYHPL
eukprot:CAMPEP_0184864948 /NCGR_PEP_ID=MMETSP0580-20130426/16482_1 /TAXON_ID=1118495 /ORGANISM="Dactyliosolen fragilissimus" /LENGTH=283 /DNA_ID=CAMNT_0027363925 /DNA_START=268 /DNA_END=1119 /DNA_ORIENTATION=+